MNIPNTLTVIRIGLIPIYLWVFYTFEEKRLEFLILILIVIGITDILDGYIARKYNMVTKLGTVLDPIADKLITFAVLISFCSKGLVPFRIFLVLLLKEFILILGGAYLYYFKNKKVIPADKLGKLATISFYLVTFFIILNIKPGINDLLLKSMMFIHLLALTNYISRCC